MYKIGNFPFVMTEQEHMVVEVIRQFVEKEIKPVRDKLDDDTEHVIINEILRKLAGLGMFSVQIAKERKTASHGIRSSVTNYIVEELALGDVGIGIVAAINTWALTPARLAKNFEIINLFNDMGKKYSPCLACFAMTEAASGCDIENLPLLRGKTIQTRAVQEGNEWVINGAKRFPSSAGVAHLYCVVCQTAPAKGEEGIALIYVPKETKGVRFGKFEVKAGMQADRNADIYFDNVRVPVSYRASGPKRDAELMKINLVNGRVSSAAAAVGSARGAFEEVLKFTETRIVGGKPVRDHSIAAGMLAEMATGIETARAHYLMVSDMLSNQEYYGEPFSDAILSQASISKNYATEMAISVTNKAMELMGSYGYIRDYHVEKYWRDVKEVQLWLGGAQLGRFDVVRGYYPFRTS